MSEQPPDTSPEAAPDAALDATPEPRAPEPAPAVPHAGIRYAVLRMSMLLTVGGVLYLFGMRSWPLLFATVIVSGIASYFVFLRQREAAARNLEASVESWRGRRGPSAGGAGQTPE